MSAHLGRKAPKAHKLRFYRSQEQGGEKVTDISEAQKRRESKQIRSLLKNRNQRTG